jgi:hypothetical protein
MQSTPRTWTNYFYSWLSYISPLPVEDDIDETYNHPSISNIKPPNIVTEQPKEISPAYYTWLRSIQPKPYTTSNITNSTQNITKKKPIMGDFYSKYAAKPEELV